LYSIQNVDKTATMLRFLNIATSGAVPEANTNFGLDYRKNLACVLSSSRARVPCTSCTPSRRPCRQWYKQSRTNGSYTPASCADE